MCIGEEQKGMKEDMKRIDDEVLVKGESYIAKIQTEDLMGNVFSITDTWTTKDGLIQIDREVTYSEVKKETAVRLTTEFDLVDSKAKSFDDYGFIIPGALYNKNDTDQNGQDDYLGTFEQDYKDDRNPNLSVTGFAKQDGQFVSLIRADVPKQDTTITRKQIEDRHFVHDTDIGSLGIAQSLNKMNEFLLRCNYTFFERNSFCLNVEG